MFKETIYIKMSGIVDVVSCLKKMKTKSLGQNKENLINYENGVKENMVRIVLFSGKNSYRIVENG